MDLGGPAEVVQEAEVVAVLADDAVGAQLVARREACVHFGELRELVGDAAPEGIAFFLALKPSAS